MPETKFTPGPWRWEVNLDSKRVELAGGTPRYDVDVLQFVRWGMSGAAPQFREDVDRMNIMHRADELAVPVKGREHHANWFRTIAHPDAHLIAAAPELYEALECAADAEEIRQYIVLGDEFHRICDKWRARAEELLSIERWPMEERFPGWVGSALRELSQKLRTTALAKARGEAGNA